MSAPQKSTGGRKTKTAKAPSARKSTRGPKRKLVGETHPSEGRISPTGAPAAGLARSDAPVLSTNLRASGNHEDHPPERPPRGRSGGGTTSPSSSLTLAEKRKASRPPAKLPKPPQGHSGYARKSRSATRRAQSKPRRYSTTNSRQRLLELALSSAEQRGYEALKISDITDPAGVQRQAFYSHFRDKRHCLCEAISPKLATIERMASSATEQETEWAAQIIDSVDEVLYARFQSQDGTKGRLITAMRELLEEKGSFAAIKIGEIVKAAHVPQGDFYKTFSGKRECFACVYEQVLQETFAGVEARVEQARNDRAATRSTEAVLRTLGEELIADPGRLHVLIVEASQLPEAEETVAGAWRGSLSERVVSLLGPDRSGSGDSSLDLLAGSVLEVVRSAVAADEAAEIPDRLASLTGLGVGGGEGRERLAA